MNACDLRDHARHCREVAASMPAGICREVLMVAAHDYELRAARLDVLAPVMMVKMPASTAATVR
jgi:hypothetical protein